MSENLLKATKLARKNYEKYGFPHNLAYTVVECDLTLDEVPMLIENFLKYAKRKYQHIVVSKDELEDLTKFVLDFA